MIRTTARLMRRQGYAATGWRQVVADSATPWGSQAHHFPGGKEQLAAEAVALAGRRYEQLLRSALSDRHPADAVSDWVEMAATELRASDWADGCPVATVTLETAHSSAALAQACQVALGSWRIAITEAITARGAASAEALRLATLVLASIEGGLLLARAHRSSEPLRLVGDELTGLLRARVP
ncbi:MAG TPA: TetR family transcriptional regulator C-terminal domain-containing protein [Streptosporangiaceae bacterium]|nr:TetR family transcriptional regulator C-terminal domain-containing protein [Streptosporangiaceae bacterium]